MTREQALTIAENRATASADELNAAERLLHTAGDTEPAWVVTREIDRREVAVMREVGLLKL